MRQGHFEAKGMEKWGSEKREISVLFPYTTGEGSSLQLQPCPIATDLMGFSPHQWDHSGKRKTAQLFPGI